MLTKEKVLSSVASLPAEFSIDDLIEKLILIEKIETGLHQVRNGMMISQEEMEQKVKSWQK
jgi:hypothetical protein